ncbi:LacI family DNA-binding transcriptional regulator [Streptomyces sp. 3MP-14]|uniref:LacI family DNA-binding transcriptional regulator n=1 Tax=Streptomyces mimosae TaxID=2586635 RepID=A0A5N6A4J4_9ACTN|nr:MULTISPECIES: LacI family DNA-binding transcriptional regulator [Streptomyces]KAB8162899.1 LacI family DNA-binding transcriptional regulator [Streptomyces mimosae]KAB8179112.1 LacI family DNA-binding transcriptional regulator [Streptomyces sp. 3MP-14]
MANGKRVTARDVAALVGVSPGTVSKALSGRGAVHPDTRERVLRAARELGLRTARTPLEPTPARDLTVGLVAQEPFGMRRTSPLLLGAMERFAEHDIAFLLCDGRGDPIREQHFAESLLRRRVNGILVAGSGGERLTRPPLRGAVGVPVVYTTSASTDPRDVSVVPDDRGGAEAAVRHLVATGRRHIACVLGPRREEAARVKVAAAREVLAEHGLALAVDPLHGPWSEEWGRQAAMRLVHGGVRLDGLVCGNDVIARGVTSALGTLGVSVPDDIGVMGFDNWAVMVEASRPRLSSVDLNLPDVGAVAADRMIEATLRGVAPRPGVTTVECDLVPRESTAVAPPGARV